MLAELPLDEDAWRKHLEGIAVAKTHAGYFSIDKKTKRLKDPEFKVVKDEETGKKTEKSDDVDAYDPILKDKERLLWTGVQKGPR